jgi:conjugal transfer pilus assembly protein TraV
MMGFARLVLLALAVSTIAGCKALSGVGGTDQYACKAPAGVLCTSVAGVYANSVQYNLPSQMAATSPLPTGPLISSGSLAPSLGDVSAIRSKPRVLRLWVAPWEDTDGDLHEQSFLHVVVDTGRWLIEHERTRIRNEFAHVTPPVEPPRVDLAPIRELPTAVPLPPNTSFVPPRGEPGEEPDAK